LLTVDFNIMPIEKGERVLDVGCGQGRHSWYVCKAQNCHVYAMDYDVECLQTAKGMLRLMDNENECRGKWNVLRGNAMRLPFKDGTFDKIICSEVLEHIQDDKQSVRELVRVLKDDGEMAVSVPAYLPESLCWKISEAYHTNPGGHIRIYRERGLINMLSSNNLTVYDVRHRHAFHSIYWLLRCIFGVRKEKSFVPSFYNRFVVWDIEKKWRVFRWLEGMMDRVFAKSVVVYLRKKPLCETTG